MISANSWLFSMNDRMHNRKMTSNYSVLLVLVATQLLSLRHYRKSFLLMSAHCLEMAATYHDSCLEHESMTKCKVRLDDSVWFDSWWHLLPFSMDFSGKRDWNEKKVNSMLHTRSSHSLLVFLPQEFSSIAEMQTTFVILRIHFKQQLSAGWWWWNVSSSFFRSCLTVLCGKEFVFWKFYSMTLFKEKETWQKLQDKSLCNFIFQRISWWQWKCRYQTRRKHKQRFMNINWSFVFNSLDLYFLWSDRSLSRFMFTYESGWAVPNETNWKNLLFNGNKRCFVLMDFAINWQLLKSRKVINLDGFFKRQNNYQTNLKFCFSQFSFKFQSSSS